mgnify:CR=1 FL=1
MNITTKGQVTIPKEVREKYGFHEGTEVEFVEEGGAVKIVKKRGTSPLDAIYGILRSGQPTDRLIEALRGR